MNTTKVKVIVRVRPFIEREIDENSYMEFENKN
jgi:hypothetical protein